MRILVHRVVHVDLSLMDIAPLVGLVFRASTPLRKDWTPHVGSISENARSLASIRSVRHRAAFSESRYRCGVQIEIEAPDFLLLNHRDLSPTEAS